MYFINKWAYVSFNDKVPETVVIKSLNVTYAPNSMHEVAHGGTVAPHNGLL